MEPHVGQKIFEDMLAEEGVEVVYSAELESVTVDSATHRISSITATADSVSTTYSADFFIDASYEGDLMAMANVSYVFQMPKTTNAQMHKCQMHKCTCYLTSIKSQIPNAKCSIHK